MSNPTADPREEARRVQAEFARPFDPDLVRFEPQQVKDARAMAMAYIDARLVADRLDEVVGLDNWQDSYTVLPTGDVECRLAVRLPGTGEWITKSDVGSQSEQPDEGDRMKAAFSDALKRAAVKFGIGRYLYRLSVQWVDYDPVKKQITRLPSLPGWAVPADCKACGPQWAAKLAGLIRVVCEQTRTDAAHATRKKLEEFRVAEGKGLGALRLRDARTLLQRLNAKLQELAAGGSGTELDRPQPAGVAGVAG